MDTARKRGCFVRGPLGTQAWSPPAVISKFTVHERAVFRAAVGDDWGQLRTTAVAAALWRASHQHPRRRPPDRDGTKRRVDCAIRAFKGWCVGTLSCRGVIMTRTVRVSRDEEVNSANSWVPQARPRERVGQDHSAVFGHENRIRSCHPGRSLTLDCGELASDAAIRPPAEEMCAWLFLDAGDAAVRLPANVASASRRVLYRRQQATRLLVRVPTRGALRCTTAATIGNGAHPIR
jgi:hypothetical protein